MGSIFRKVGRRMLGFIFGVVIGAMIGIIVCSLMVAASEGYTVEDEWLELMLQQNEKKRRKEEERK